jgi:predicted metal-binding membrane protein
VFAPTVAYAAAGWADLCTEPDIRTLNSIQQNVLIPVVGAYRTSSRESLCVTAGATPVEILLQKGRARYKIRKNRDVKIGNIVVSAGDKNAAVKIIKEEGVRMWQT